MARLRDARLMALRCLIVDDCRHFLDAARTLLEREGLAVVGVASTTAEALRRIQDVKPDVALVDVELGNESGLDLVRRIHSETSLDPSRVILISCYTDEDFEDLITDAPVAALLSKSRLSACAIREILNDIGDA
jgi:DNA-binding NarL/FixJ family response regulator